MDASASTVCLGKKKKEKKSNVLDILSISQFAFYRVRKTISFRIVDIAYCIPLPMTAVGKLSC